MTLTKKLLSLLILLSLFLPINLSAQVSGQTAGRIRFGATLPATCNPNTGDVFFRTATNIGIHDCTATNTWTFIGAGGSGISGSGSNTQVTFWTGASAVSGDAGLTYDAATDALTIVGSISLNGSIITGNGTTMSVASPLLGPVGSTTNPTYGFSANSNMGLYRAANNQIGVAIGGAQAVLITSGSIGLTGSSTAALNLGASQDSVLQRNQAGGMLHTHGAVTATASTNYFGLAIQTTGAVTVPSGTTAVVSSLGLDEPNITATGTVTTAATLYISGVPTEGGVNYAGYSVSGTWRMGGYGDGAATFSGGTGTITSVSDVRLKDVQGDYNYGLAELLKIQPILYKWNAASHMQSDRVYAGFSAQDVDAALPDYGTGRDENGYYTLQDRAIMATLVNAIKSIDARLKVLEGR